MDHQQPSPGDIRCITVPELAELWGIAQSTAYQWTEEPGFPIIQRGKGQKKLIPLFALRRWMEEQLEGSRDVVPFPARLAKGG